MSRAELYLERSQTYAASAAMTEHPGLKVALLQMAQNYAHLASVADRNAELEAINDSVTDALSNGDSADPR
jgi:hypothetical protein